MNRYFVYIIIGVIIYFLVFKKPSGNNIENAFKKALKYFSPEIVKNAEKIYRIETADFTSGQFKGTFSAGMEKATNTYPYGWNTLKNSIWKTNPEYKPIGLKTFTENRTGIQKTFLKFANFEAGLMTLCAFLKIFNNNPGRWFSTDPVKQQEYTNAMNKFSSNITDNIV